MEQRVVIGIVVSIRESIIAEARIDIIDYPYIQVFDL